MSDALSTFDDARLELWLTENVPDYRGPFVARKFSDGQSNPTFLIEAASGRYVLRRKPFGQILKSAHAVDREYRVMTALRDSGVPVPRTVSFCGDESVIGTDFFVMEFLDGRVFWDPALPELPREDRSTVHDELNRVIAVLHSIDVQETGLSDFGKPGNYFERQVSRWTTQYRNAETGAIPEMEMLIRWLPENTPADDGRVALVHGDCRLDNMMFDKLDYRVIGLLDWELSTLGHPFADLAYQCMSLRMDSDWFIRGLGGLDRDELGILSEEAYVARYCQRMGIDGIENWHFYLAFSFFRLASIIQGVRRRALDGNASSEQALTVGEMVRPVAAKGAELCA